MQVQTSSLNAYYSSLCSKTNPILLYSTRWVLTQHGNSAPFSLLYGHWIWTVGCIFSFPFTCPWPWFWSFKFSHYDVFDELEMGSRIGPSSWHGKMECTFFFFFNLHVQGMNHLHSLVAYERKLFDRTNFGQRGKNKIPKSWTIISSFSSLEYLELDNRSVALPNI